MLIIPLALASVAQNLPPIATDRPDFTEGARAVPHKSAQIETGFTYERTDGFTAWTLPEALVRASLSHGLEARIGLPGYVSLSNGIDLDGLTDLSLGLKQELNQDEAVDLAAIAMVTFPTGDPDVRADRTTPLLALAWATDSVAGMVQAEFPGGPALFRNTLVVSKPMGEDMSIFAEHVLDFSEIDRPSHVAHFGLARALGNDAQFDFHFGFGLTTNAPDFFVGAGYSLRF